MFVTAKGARDLYAQNMAEPFSPPGASLPYSATWRIRQPSALIEHVVEVHHEPTRAMLAKIDRLLGCVTDAFCVRPPLPEIATEFARLRTALIAHLDLEEAEIFSVVRNRFADGRTIAKAIARANQDHVALQLEVVRLRAMSAEMHAMEDTCRAMRTLDAALADLERDLLSHFQLESEVLFPRAEELERSVREESRR